MSTTNSTSSATNSTVILAAEPNEGGATPCNVTLGDEDCQLSRFNNLGKFQTNMCCMKIETVSVVDKLSANQTAIIDSFKKLGYPTTLEEGPRYFC